MIRHGHGSLFLSRHIEVHSPRFGGGGGGGGGLTGVLVFFPVHFDAGRLQQTKFVATIPGVGKRGTTV